MSWNYARQTIAAILARSNGNAMQAARLVTEEALKDNRLLQELTTPHLKGIVGHAIDRVLREQKNAPEHHPDQPERLNMPLDAFGMSLLGALSGRNTPRFAQEDAAPPTGHKAASRAHIDAIYRIARVQESKRKG